MKSLSVADVARCMAIHAPLYAWRKPVYQYVALETLRQLWNPAHRTALDVGGGTGIIAQTIKTLFELDQVVAIDVENRYRPGLDVGRAIYDGTRLPFRDASFDCVLLFNVLHHVPVASRAALIHECRRVAGRGPIYIKDHLSTGAADDARLSVLDALGNVPFHGMVRARYLRAGDWDRLASETSHTSTDRLSGPYRSGASAALFPNRLEVSMRWLPN